MSTIGLYDIDLWHRGRSFPNLELMKTLNYFLQNNEQIIMMTPKDDEGRFNKIIYFKDNANIMLPSQLEVLGERKDIYGYGFFKEITPLKPEIAITPPSYLPYDPWSNKLRNSSTYDLMKRSSYIRLETNDFTDFKPNMKNIYIADHNFFYLKNAEDFLKEHKNNHNFKFIHRLEVQDEETAIKFIPYSILFDRRIALHFRYSENFFYTYYKDAILFDVPRPQETEDNYLQKVIKIILWNKCKNNSYQYQNFSFIVKRKELYRKILIWGNSPIKESYQNFYQGDNAAQRELETIPSEFRLLLKQNPKTITRQSLDLKSNL